jgi:hypothetical protein
MQRFEIDDFVCKKAVVTCNRSSRGDLRYLSACRKFQDKVFCGDPPACAISSPISTPTADQLEQVKNGLAFTFQPAQTCDRGLIMMLTAGLLDLLLMPEAQFTTSKQIRKIRIMDLDETQVVGLPEPSIIALLHSRRQKGLS